jgi:hypothetical protein
MNANNANQFVFIRENSRPKFGRPARERTYRGWREWNFSSRLVSAWDKKNHSRAQAAIPSTMLMLASISGAVEAESKKGREMAVKAASKPAAPLSVRRSERDICDALLNNC